MRHPEPEAIKKWREGPPKCCHTCDSYDDQGLCLQYNHEPPEEFAASEQCEHWLYAMPF